MKRREFLAGLKNGALAVTTIPLIGNISGISGETAEEIYKRSYVTDAMCFGGAPPRNYVPYLTESKVEALRTSGFTAISMCVSSGTTKRVDNIFAGIQENIEKWDSFIEKHPDVFMKVTSGALLDEAKRSGKVGLIYNLQQSALIGWNLDRLKTLVDLSVRQIQLSYNQRNYSADGCMEKTNAAERFSDSMS